MHRGGIIICKSNNTYFTPNCFEPQHDKTNKMMCAPSEDLDQPGHPTSLIRVFVVRMKKPLVLSYPQCTAKTDQTGRMPRLIWVFVERTGHFAGFVMLGLFCFYPDINECASNPCKNKGKCVDKVNGYTCTCTTSYKGTRCETEKGKCFQPYCWYDIPVRPNHWL